MYEEKKKELSIKSAELVKAQQELDFFKNKYNEVQNMKVNTSPDNL